MVNVRALTVSLAKTGLGFLPLLLAPLLLGPSTQLLLFFKLQLVQSILMVFGSLGVGSYIFLLSESARSSRKATYELLSLTAIFNIVGVLLFLFGCFAIFASILFKIDLSVALYVLVAPFSYFYVVQQIQLGKQDYYLALVNYAIPSITFSVLLVCVYIGGVENFQKISIATLLFANIIFFKRYKVIQSIKMLINGRRLKLLFRAIFDIRRQIYAGILLATCTPVISLVLINWLSDLQYYPQLIGAYYLYVRGIEALISLVATYFIAGHFHKKITLKLDFLSYRRLFLFGVLAIVFYALLNFAVYLLIGYVDLFMSAIELATGLIKLALAILTVSFLGSNPLISGSKEGITLIAILILKQVYLPASIYSFQISVMICFLMAICLMLPLFIRSFKNGAGKSIT